VNPLIVVLTLLVTIAGALALGVVLGYAAIYTILHAMRRQSQTVTEHALAATQASGD
jgi:NhaP-type Na+/H+ or K+/H+ antiporter